MGRESKKGSEKGERGESAGVREETGGQDRVIMAKYQRVCAMCGSAKLVEDGGVSEALDWRSIQGREGSPRTISGKTCVAWAQTHRLLFFPH